MSATADQPAERPAEQQPAGPSVDPESVADTGPTVEQDAGGSAGRPAEHGTTGGGSAPADGPVAAEPAGPAQPDRPRPRTGPIVWGCLILAFCAYAVQRVLFPGGVDTALWITATVLGLGALLLGVGIAIAIRSARRR